MSTPREQLHSIVADYNQESDPLRALKLIEAMRWIKRGLKLMEIENIFLRGGQQSGEGKK